MKLPRFMMDPKSNIWCLYKRNNEEVWNRGGMKKPLKDKDKDWRDAATGQECQGLLDALTPSF